MKILIISLSNLGDAMLTYPALHAIFRAYPDAEYHLLAPPKTQELFGGDHRFHHVLSWEPGASLLAQVALTAKLAWMRFDLVVDFRNSLIPLFLLGAKRTPIFRRNSDQMHRVERHLNLTRRLGIPSEQGGAALPYGSQEQGQVNSWIEEGKRVVVMVPGARSDLKRWGAERFAAVADHLIQEQNAQILLIGAQSEAPIAEEVKHSMRGNPTNLTGKTSIRQLAALLGRTELMITNDCACLHAAELMQVPTVAIFGPTDERKYGPRHRASRVVRRKLICAPCEKAQCVYGHECMKWVEVQEVCDAAVGILQQR